jgi:hypothetical protein
MAGASNTGTSHHATQTPCQDSHRMVVDGDRLIIAVSDGMGSAKYSHHSSRLLVDTVVQTLITPPRPQKRILHRLGSFMKRFVVPSTVTDSMRHAVQTGRAAIVRLAARRRHELRDYACTLLVVVVDSDGWNVLHIGDGAVVGFRSVSDLKTLSRPYNGEYANSTSPITAPNWQRYLRANSGPQQLSAVAVLSDGIQNLCINHQTGDAFPGFFQPLLQWFIDMPVGSDYDTLCGQFLQQPTITGKSDDDLTLCVAWRD